MVLPLLTPATRLKTNVLFPTFGKDEETGRSTLYPDPNEKILIESSAELMNVDLPGNKYGTSNDFILLHDLNGQPMILSLGMDNTSIFAHPKFEASVCDASKSPDNTKILIAVSGYYAGDKSNTKLYRLVLDCPKLIADEKGTIVGLSFQNLPWLEVGRAISSREVKTLVCEYFGREFQYQIVAGVSATTLEGSHYIYNPSRGLDWTLVKFPQQVETIRSCVSANLPILGPGYVVLFEDNTAARTVSCFFQGDGVSTKVYLNGLQNPRRLCTHVNNSGCTDILIAADNGIGFINTENMLEAPKLLLSGIACSHVLSSEGAILKNQSTILIFALSTHGELFAIQGVRNEFNDDSIAFLSSSLSVPIRNGVRNIAGKINPLTGAFETVYVSMDNSILKHLTRDPVTFLWNEAEMIVRSDRPNTRINTPAFVLTLTLTNGKGLPVPCGYTLQLSSAPTLVQINDRSYNLTRRPQSIPVNAFGQLQIVIPVADSLSTADIGIKFLPNTGDTQTYYIQPSQRVIYTLGNLTTGDALKNARTSDNRPFFSEAHKQQHGDKFEQAANLLSKVPLMIAATGSGAGKTETQMSEETTIAWEKNEAGVSSSGTGWLSDAVDAIGEGIGDVIEYLKIAVQQTVKIALKIVGPAVRLILKIGAKVIRYVLDSVSSIVTSVTYALEHLLGVDLSGLRDLVSFHYKKVETTQKELASIIKNGLLLTSRYLHQNHSVLSNGIDTFGLLLERYITRPYPLQMGSKSESSGSSLLNNPIITNLMKFNPLAWIMEAMAEEVGDDVQIPPLNLNIPTQLLAGLKEQFEILLEFLKRSWSSFEAAISQPEGVMKHLHTIFRDGFWTIFGSLKAIFLTIYSVLMNSFDAICQFCSGRWKIPGMTDMWEDLTNTDFTLINFVSYIGAQVLELGNPKSTSVLEGMTLSAVLEDLSENKMPSIFPEDLSRDLEAYEGSGGGSFEEIMSATKIAQEEGAALLAANPVTQPRFGLLATATAQLRPHGEPSMPPPSPAVRYVLALARSGKQLTRVANAGIEGLSQGGSGGGGSENSGAGGPGSQHTQPAGSLDNLLGKFDKIDDTTLDTSFHLSDTSLTDSASSGSLSPKTPSVKTLMVGTNAFGLCCRVAEQFILHNYYDQAGREMGNYDGNCVELIASLGGLILAFFADIPPILALSNLLVSVGSFTGACFASDKDFAQIAYMVGPGCSAVNSILFLVKDPSGVCPTIAWCLFGVDTVATLGCIGMKWNQDSQLKPHSGQEPSPALEDPQDEKKKIKVRVVTGNQEREAKKIGERCTTILEGHTPGHTRVGDCKRFSEHINRFAQFLLHFIIHRKEYEPVNQGYEREKADYRQGLSGALSAVPKQWPSLENSTTMKELRDDLDRIDRNLRDLDEIMKETEYIYVNA